MYGIILPFRLLRTQHAYKTIWTKQGSPLRQHSEALCKKLQHCLGKNYQVALGMRYGNPSIERALNQLKDCDRIIVLPLYPQYSSAATGSSIEEVLHLIAKKKKIPHLQVISHFYDHPEFVRAQAALVKPYLANNDMVLFSYHGLPEEHLRHVGCQKICSGACPTSSEHRDCYRYQCFATTSYIAQELHLKSEQYMTAFQSRLGRTPWIKPYFDDVLEQLAQRNIKRLAVVCPSFVADCLETLEEIGIRAQQRWQVLGGESLSVIPCLNSDQIWCDAIIALVTTPAIE